MSTRTLVGALLATGLTIGGAAAGADAAGMPGGAMIPTSPAAAPAADLAAPGLGAKATQGAYFRDAFNFRAPAWRGVVGRWNVRNGTLFSQGMAGRFSSVAHINNYDEFDYEVRMNRVGNSDGSAPNCLIIRGNANRLSSDLWLPGYYFCYSNNGKALVVAVDSRGQQRELMPWTPVQEIGTGGGYRTVRVEAIGPTFYFSVNGSSAMAFKDATSAFGQVGAGFYVESGKRGSLAIDYANLGPVRSKS